MTNCNDVRTPLEKNLQLLNKTEQVTSNPYRELLGSLMYCMLCARPDICYAVGYLGRFQQSPGETHWTALKRDLRYVKGTKGTETTF